MPERFEQTMHEMLAQTRAVLTELKSLGVDEIYAQTQTESLPVCSEPQVVDTNVQRCDCRPETLEEIRADLGDCQRCKLSKRRSNLVFGSGNPHAQLVLIGESPGHQEDESGLPFAGPAGQLLDRILFAMGLERAQVYLCSMVKCPSPSNRTPNQDEQSMCAPFLQRQLKSIKPRVIVTLGEYASQSLLQQQAPIDQLRGHWGDYQGMAVMPTLHPAQLLRQPAGKRDVWEDMKTVLQRLAQEESS